MWPTLIWLWLTLSGKAPPKRAPRRRPPFLRPSSRPRLEALEDRCLMSAGALDTTFNPNGSPPGTMHTYTPSAGLAIQPDGKIVAASLPSTGTGFQVARYNGDGSLDTSFNGTGTVVTQFRNIPIDVAIQPDGKIVVCGFGSNQFAVARYTTTGALDQSFGQHGIAISSSSLSSSIFSGGRGYLTIQPDGKIVVAGSASGSANQQGIGLVRFNSNGSMDPSFGTGGWVLTPFTIFPFGDQLTPKDMAMDAAGRLVVVGHAKVYGTGNSPFVARYNSNGSLDTSLGGRGVIPLTQFMDDPSFVGEALQTDGQIVLASGINVIRLNPDGSLDTTSFGPLNPDGSHAGYVSFAGGGCKFNDVQLESDGKMVLPYLANGSGVIRLLSDGSPDPSFGSGGVSQLEVQVGSMISLAIQPADGNIVVGGGGGLARFVGDTPTPAGATTLSVAYFPSAIRAGVTGTFTVWADNAVVGLATGYTGTVHFTSSDPQAVLPADYTFTAADHSAHTFSATFKTAGTQSLFVTDTVTGSLAASQTGIRVSAAAASQFSISAPASVTSGVAFSVTVTAVDPYGNAAYYYYRTVHVTSSDPSATLPPDYTFLGGVHAFTGLVLRTKGVQTLTITDLANGTIFGTISVDVV